MQITGRMANQAHVAQLAAMNQNQWRTGRRIRLDVLVSTFHRAMGFTMKPSQTTIDGIPYHQDYDGPGEDRIVFVKPLDPLLGLARE